MEAVPGCRVLGRGVEVGRSERGVGFTRIPLGIGASQHSHDPLLTYLMILPSILIFFARQRVIAQRKGVQGLAAAAPRATDEFIRHVQRSARAMLRSDL